MKLIYLAGPYRACDQHSIDDHIEIARAVAKRVWQIGMGQWAVITPHLNTAHFDGVMEDEVFLSAGLEILKRCDKLIYFGDWLKSPGTRAEIKLAHALGIPVQSYESFEAIEAEYGNQNLAPV